jgi:hypothetical protein
MKSWLSTLALCIGIATVSARGHMAFPEEILALTKAHSCEVVSDYFDTRTSTGEDPPYAVSVDAQKVQVAAWCTPDQSKPEDQRSYVLLVKIDDQSSPLAKCPTEVRGIKHVGGLRFVNISDDVKYYYYVESRKRVASGGVLHVKGLESMYDGVGERFACINGKWAFNAVD